MANQKVYKIVIEGVDVAIKDINTLREALNDIGDNKSSKATDELAAAQSRLAKALNENAQEVASVKAAAKEAMDIAKLQAQVNDNVEGSYNRLSAQYSLNKIALNKMSEEERRTTDEGKKLVEETNEIYQKMKELQAETGKMSLNVGNYTDSINKAEVTTKSLKEELKSIKDEMANMVLNGEKGSEAYQKLAQRAGELKDAMADANDEISHFASDTRGIDNVINLASTATAAFGVYQGVMATLNIEDEEFEKTMQKMAGIMTTLNSLQELQNNLTKDGSATAAAYHTIMKALGLEKTAQVASTKALTTATEANTVATNAATVATHGLGFALKAIGIGLIIAAVAALIEYWDDLVGWFKKTFPELNKLEGAFNKLKQVFYGVGNAVLQFLIAPLKTFAAVMADVINGDWDKILEDSTKYLKEGLDFAKNYNEGVQNEITDQNEKAWAKRNEIQRKANEDQLKDEEAKYGKSHKRTQEYLKKQMALTKKGTDEYKELQRQLWTDIREEQDEHDREMKQKHQKALKDRMDAEKQASKEYQQLLKDIETATKDSRERMDESFKNTLESEVEKYTTIVDRPMESIKDVFEDAGEAMVAQVQINSSKMLAEIDRRYMELLKKAGVNLGKVEETFKKVDYDTTSAITQSEANALSALTELNAKIYQQKLEIGKMFNEGLITKEEADDYIRQLYILAETEFNTIITQFRGQSESIVREVTKSHNQIMESFKGMVLNKDQMKIYEAYLTEIGAVAGKVNYDISKVQDTIWKDSGEAAENLVKLERDKMSKTLDELLEDTETKLNEVANKLSGTTKFLSNKMNEVFKPKEFKENLDDYRMQWAYNLSWVEERFRTFLRTWKGDLEEIKWTYGEDSDEYREALEKKDELNAGYLEMVKIRYGENSDEYKKALKEEADAYVKFLNFIQNARNNADFNMDIPLHSSTTGITTDTQKVQKKNPIQKAMESWDEAPYETIADIYDEINDLVLYPAEDAFNAYLDFVIQEAEEALEEVQKLHDEAIDRVDESTDRISELQDKIKNGNKDEVESMKQALADEQLLLAQRTANEERLAREEEQKERELRHREKQQQRLDLGRSLIEASVNTAMGVTKALGDYGWPLGPIFAGFIAAMGAVQTAFIAKQIAKLQDGGSIELGNGGKVSGKSHSQGGVPVGNTGIEVEGGEVVINKKSSKKFLPLLDAINADGNGGKHTVMKGNTTTVNDYVTNTKFETGGVINNYSTSNAYSTVFNRTLSNGGLIKSYTINKIYKTEKMDVGGRFNFEKADSVLRENDTSANLLKAMENIDFHPVVSVVDINRGQKNLTKVQQLAGKR